MAKDIEEKIGAMSQKNCHGLKYKYPLKNYRVHKMPTGDQLPPHYKFEWARTEEIIMIKKAWCSEPCSVVQNINISCNRTLFVFSMYIYAHHLQRVCRRG